MNKTISIRILILTGFIHFLLIGIVATAIFYLMTPLWQTDPTIPPLISDFVQFRTALIPIAAGLWLAFTLVLWLLMRAVVKNAVSVSESTEDKTKTHQTDAEVKKMQEKRDKRLFLHLLSVLQKEGRLIDFFAEDLEQFEDEQIGAAVRTIHENCKKMVFKYLKPEPVHEGDEGEATTIPNGFDTEKIKLIGNVAGNPPFKGILRHKGWQTKDFELPVLSKTDHPLVIAPAEVEVE